MISLRWPSAPVMREVIANFRAHKAFLAEIKERDESIKLLRRIYGGTRVKAHRR